MPDQFEIPEDITPQELAGALFGRPVRREGREMVRLEIAEPDEADPDWTPLHRVDGGEGEDTEETSEQ